MPRPSLTAASAALAAADPVMGGLYDRIGPCRLRARLPSPFEALVRAIVYQQLSGQAAGTIHGRLVEALGGQVSPERILGLPVPALRAAGLSEAKTRSVIDLAEKASTGAVPLDRLSRMRDEDIIERLVGVRGIGRWTAEMFLIFQLRRMDVWPVDDLGVRKGYALAYGLPDLPPPRQLAELGARFQPYRSVAAWYCWRANDVTNPLTGG